MTKTKRNLIITFSLLGFVLLLVVVFSVLFSVKKIYVEVLSNTGRLNAYTEEAVIKDSTLKKGKSIVFANTDKAVSSLEKAFPYAKFKIVRTFPSTLTIYLYEREPVFKVKNSKGYFEVYDEDLKCLAIVSEAGLREFKLDDIPTLNNADINLTGEEGKKIEDLTLSHKITQIVSGVYGASASKMSVMSDITFEYIEENQLSQIVLSLRTTREGLAHQGKLIIQGDKDIKLKIAYALHTYYTISDKEEYSTSPDKLSITALNNFDPNYPTVIVRFEGNEVQNPES